MNKKTIKVCLAGLLAASSMAAQTTAVNLQTLYTNNPIGIETTPTLSWQIHDESQAYGVAQTAYQIVSAKTLKDLEDQHYIYNSGKIQSSNSVGIKYAGKIEPCTRYYWQVKVWNNKGKEGSFSLPAYFETGLMDKGWNGAKWISSPKTMLSQYRSNYTIDYDFKWMKGSRQATFVLGARDKYNYVHVNLQAKPDNAGALLSVGYMVDGKDSIIATEDISHVIKKANLFDKHHVKIDVQSTAYVSKYNLDIYVDGVDITNHLHPRVKHEGPLSFFSEYEGSFRIIPKADAVSYPYCRLYGIGFRQPKNEVVEFSNICISYDRHERNLWKDGKTQLVKGDGELHTWLPSDETHAPIFRKTVSIDKPVKSARLYATARGIYDFSINQQEISGDFYNPGWTDYRYRIFYNTYDVTPMLRQGANELNACVGTGWYSGMMGYEATWQDQYGLRQSLMAKLVIEYADGSQQTVVTDNTWQVYDQGPVVENSLLNGEDYDARLEVLNPALWQEASVVAAPGDSTKIIAYVGGTIQEAETLTARGMTEPRKGIFVYDMGENMVGVPRLSLHGKKGQKITIHYAEMLWPTEIPTQPVEPYTTELYRQNAGLAYTDNYRSALSTDTYICKGDESEETFEPKFTLHGYRYIQIEGLEKALSLEDVKGVVLHSIGEQQSSYETDNAQVNQLYKNILRGQKGNFLSVPTDCPQRDERLGWTGDAQVFSQTATYNYNVNSFFHRWLYSMRDDQDAAGNYPNYAPCPDKAGASAKGGGLIGWSDAGVIIPWNMYVQYADQTILEEHYPSMKKFMGYMESRLKDNYVMPTGGFGDWLAFKETDTQLTNTLWMAYDCQLMSKAAQVLGREEDARHYARLSESIRASFNQYFLRADGKTIIPKGGELGFFNPEIAKEEKLIDTQTSYIMPLQFQFFEDKQNAIQHLVDAIDANDGLLSTGFIGTPHICNVLSANGLDSIAYQLFEEKRCPSWLYPVEQGATTIWERWNSFTRQQGFGPVGMNSFNHYSYGAIEEWMVKYTLGIQPDESQPGYKHFFLDPHPGGHFRRISGSINTVNGKIESGWTKDEAGNTQYGFTIPANTTATLKLSGKYVFKEGKEGIISKNSDGTVNLASGKYLINAKK